MSKLTLVILVTLSFLFSPVAEATYFAMADYCDDVHFSQSVDDHADHQGQGEKSAHHHCCTYSIAPAIASASVISKADSATTHAIIDEALTSFTVGPLLKPPSHV